MEERRKKTPAIKPLIDLIVVIIICVAALQLSPTVKGILFDRVYNASPQIAVKYLADKENIVTAKELLQYEKGELRAIDIVSKKAHFYAILPYAILPQWENTESTVSLLVYPDYAPKNNDEIMIEESQEVNMFNDFALSVLELIIENGKINGIQVQPGYVEVEGYLGLAGDNKINFKLTSLKSMEYTDIPWEEGQIISEEDFEPNHIVEVNEQIGENGQYILETIEFCKLGAIFKYVPSGKGTDIPWSMSISDRGSRIWVEDEDSKIIYWFGSWIQPTASLKLQYDMEKEDNGQMVSTGENFELTVDTQ